MEDEKNNDLFGEKINRRELLKRGSMAAGAAILLSSGVTGSLFAAKKEKKKAGKAEGVKVVGATAMERAVNSA